MRSSMLENIRQDYVQTARAKGLSEPRATRSPALSLLWFHGSVKREMNGMKELFCLMIKKVKAEFRKFNIKYPVFSLRSLHNLMIVYKLC